MKRLTGVLQVLLVVVVFLAASGCMTTELCDRLGRDENYITNNTNAIDDVGKKTDGIESRVAALEKFQTDASGAMDSLNSRITKNEAVITRVEGKLTSLQKELYKRLGILSDQTQILYPKFNGRKTPVMIGPFAPGSATMVINKTGKFVSADAQIAEVSKCLGKKCIDGVTVTVEVSSIVSGHDSDPIKKSEWKSNEELAWERGAVVARSLGFQKEKEIFSCLDSQRHGSGKTDNRYVFIFFDTFKE